jgi:SAM-dependent methyltransferase
MSQTSFEQLVQEALDHSFSGWDFSWLDDRWHEAAPSWDYRQMVQVRIKNAPSLLDMGTGGGEFLSSLTGLPPTTYATEGYAPNISIAKERLEPLGITVVEVVDDNTLPLPSNAFDLVINRHESYALPEVCRILRPGGLFLTQQVGPRDCVELNQYLQAPLEPDIHSWSLAQEKTAVEEAGLRIVRCQEQLLSSVFYAIGAVVYYLKVIEWQIPDFSTEAYRERLEAMHRLIERQGAFFATAHRFLIEAEKR